MLAPFKSLRIRWPQPAKWLRKTTKRTVPLVLAIYFAPMLFAFYVLCGTLDVLRNTRRTRSTIDRYFAGNGVFTWLLSPFNLMMDLLSLPHWNRGIYRLEDLPEAYQAEIRAIIEAAHARDIVGQLRARTEQYKRGMYFFKWYGRNVRTTLDVPEFHQKYRYIQTIGVSVFNKRQSTSKHYGPLRITLRVLYNINHIESDQVYIRVGNHTHYWRTSKLFIFDDTLQHQSCNESDEPRYCMFLDIQRPSLVPGLLRGILAIVRRLVGPINSIFYRQWTFVK